MMKGLKTVVSALFLLTSISSFSQNYSGTWIGVFNDDMGSQRKIVRFAFQLQQKGRAVWGVYTSGENLTIKYAQCACTVNAQLGKKNRTSIDFYKDGLISSQISESACDFVVNLEANYIQKDAKEYLAGKWFGNATSSKRSDGASGDFTVMKISDTVNIDVNSYFPKLDKMIEKANPGDTSFRKKDNPVLERSLKDHGAILTPKKLPIAVPFDFALTRCTNLKVNRKLLFC